MDTIHFKKKIFATGGSLAVTLPPEITSYLEMKEGDENRCV